MLFDDLKPFLKDGTKPEEVSPIIDKGRFETISSKEAALKVIDENEHFKAARDFHVSTGIESFKKNHYEADIKKAVDAKIVELYPAETPEQKRLAELEKKLAEKDKTEAEKDAQLARERTLNKLSTIADTELKLPAEIKPLIPFFLGADEKSSTENLKTVADIIGKIIASAQKGIIDKYGQRIPDGGMKDITPASLEEQITEANKKGDHVLAMRLLGKLDKLKQGV
jgi:hypothetical protein